MSKTKEELLQLKKEYELLSSKLSDLSEDELNEVVGAGITIKPLSGPTFWQSYNPNSLCSGLNGLNKCEFNGNISNRDDE